MLCHSLIHIQRTSHLTKGAAAEHFECDYALIIFQYLVHDCGVCWRKQEQDGIDGFYVRRIIHILWVFERDIIHSKAVCAHHQPGCLFSKHCKVSILSLRHDHGVHDALCIHDVADILRAHTLDAQLALPRVIRIRHFLLCHWELCHETKLFVALSFGVHDPAFSDKGAVWNRRTYSQVQP